MRKCVDQQNVGDVYELVVGEPATVRLGAKLRDAVECMIINPVSQRVYVVDKKGKLAGAITMQTLLREVGHRIGARKQGMVSFLRFLNNVLKDDVDGFMEKKPTAVTKEDSLIEATRLMVEKGLNNLPVVDTDGKLIGELNGLEILVACREVV